MIKLQKQQELSFKKIDRKQFYLKVHQELVKLQVQKLLLNKLISL
jgi:hypothetical protein